MNPEQLVHEKHKNGECHKAAWVMSILSDDEAGQQGGELPQGLQFHLNRCATCRALAERIVQTTRTLGELSQENVSDQLLQNANARTIQALRRGAPLSALAESLVDEPVSVVRAKRFAFWGTRYAAAALIVLAAGLWGLFYSVGEKAGTPTSEPNSDPITLQDSRQETPFAPNEIQPGERKGHSNDAANSQVAVGGKAPNIRRYRTHEEAAESDDTRIVPTAVILPDLSKRDVELLKWFDKPTQFLSNSPGSDHK